MSGAARCPRCSARAVVATRLVTECLACGEQIAGPVDVMSSRVWGTPVNSTTEHAVDRGRHFADDDEERFA